MQPARAAGHDLQRLHRRAGGRQHRKGIGLGVERVGVAEPDQCRPMPLEDAKPWRTPDAATS